MCVASFVSIGILLYMYIFSFLLETGGFMPVSAYSCAINAGRPLH